MLGFAKAVFSYQLVVALVLPNSLWDGDVSPQSCPVHLKTRMQIHLRNELYIHQPTALVEGKLSPVIL